MTNPVLTIAISTFNRVERLEKTITQILKEVNSLKNPSDVELIVVDNASTDDTYKFLTSRNFHNVRLIRNSVNQGMLGNLNICALRSTGNYVWCIGDDDFLIPGALTQVLEIAHKSVNRIIYLNYAHDLAGGEVRESNQLEPVPTRIKKSGELPLWKAIQANSNLMTAIYTMVLRRDQAIQCYSVTSLEEPFSSLNACVPTTVYALSLSPETKVDWIADPIVAVDLRVSWIKFAPVWILERFSEMILEFVAWGEGKINLEYVFAEMRPGINHWLDQSLAPEFVKATDFKFLRGLLSLYGEEKDAGIQDKINTLS